MLILLHKYIVVQLLCLQYHIVFLILLDSYQKTLYNI